MSFIRVILSIDMQKNIFFILFILLYLSSSIVQAQPCTPGSSNEPVPTKCFEIVSILVDACDGTNEGKNEMVRLRIGSNPITLSTLGIGNYVAGNVNWGNPATSNDFRGWSGITATVTNKVATINNSIKAKGNCGVLIPLAPSNQIPAKSNFLIITSTAFNPSAQDFSNLQDTLYVAFQIAGNIEGHFSNHGTASTRRLILKTNNSCADTVIYDRSDLIKQDQTVGDEDGGIVNFSFSGAATYVNYGCAVPIAPINIDAGTVAGPYCQGATVNLNGTYSGTNCYFWYPENRSSGSFADSTNKITQFYISSGFTGTAKLYFRAQVNCGIIKDSVSFTVNPSGITLDISTNDTVWCNKNTFPLLATSNSSNALTWSTNGKGSFSSTSTLGTNYNPSSTQDTGFVILRLNQTASCGFPKDSIRVRFTQPNANFNPTIISVCKGAPIIQLNPINAGGTFSGSILISGNTFNPSDTGTFFIKHKYSQYACTDSITKTITVLPIPNANFTISDTVVCKNSNPVVFTAAQSGGTWSGTALTGNTFNPTTSGLFQFNYVLSNGICKDSISKFVRVVDKANSDFIISDTIVCSLDGKAVLTPFSSGGTFYGNGVTGNIFNVGSLNGLISIKYVIGNGTCIDSTIKTIRVVQRSNPSFTSDDTLVCIGSSIINFNFQTPGGILSGAGLSGNTFNPVAIGIYPIQYKVSKETCSDSSNISIRVISKPNASFTVSDTLVCEGAELIDIISNTAGGIFTGATITANQFDPKLSGVYSIQYKVSNEACVDSTQKNIRVSARPIAKFIYSPKEPVVKDSVRFTFTGSNATKYFWMFGDENKQNSSDQNPSFIYTKPGIFICKLIVKNDDGCIDSTDESLTIAETATLFASNVFTPNGDSTNDRFFAIGTSIKDFHMYIYNRWGDIVFESNEINNGWTGDSNGNPCPDGVYMYIINAKGTNDKTYNLHGTVTLIR
jgi:gliding motility-associated-like protein